VVQPPSGEITQLLNAARTGQTDALDRLLALVYPSLRGMAAHLLHAERQGHTLQPTALVHEALIRIFLKQDVQIQDRAHMMILAGRQMRRVLVTHARSRLAARRGGGAVPVELSEETGLHTPGLETLIVLDDLLNHLRQADPRAFQIVELRFFAGLTREEVAQCLNISVRTVQRDWEAARAWMVSALGCA
jgi:RNA polymerase sigma factor (TIGR02999 family)